MTQLAAAAFRPLVDADAIVAASPRQLKIRA